MAAAPTEQSAQAVQYVFEKLGEIAHTYGPSAVDTATQVVHINAISSLVTIPALGLIAIGAAFGARWCQRRTKLDGYDSSYWWFPTLLGGVITIVCSVLIICAVFDLWMWIGLFNPKLALAHEVMKALAAKVS